MTEQEITTGRNRNRLLWVVLVITAAVNAGLSTVNVYLGLVFGVIALGCAVALITRHYRR
jgi:hypothetical protein